MEEEREDIPLPVICCWGIRIEEMEGELRSLTCFPDQHGECVFRELAGKAMGWGEEGRL